MGMTHDQILEKWDGMTPRERDAWIAEVVFGWRPLEDGRMLSADGYMIRTIPEYTTDIYAAWSVFECHPYVEAARIPRKDTVYGVRINDSDDGTILAMTQKPTFPEAMGLAAIIAKLSPSV